MNEKWWGRDAERERERIWIIEREWMRNGEGEMQKERERERERRCREKERLLDINMLTPCFLGGYPWQCHYDKPGTGSGHLSVLWYFVVNVGNQFLSLKKKNLCRISVKQHEWVITIAFQQCSMSFLLIIARISDFFF